MQKTVVFASKEQVPALKELWQICFAENQGVLDVFFHTLFNPDQTLVILDGDRPVSALYLLPSLWRDGFTGAKGDYIYAVATHPDYRGKGLASLLLEKAKVVAADRGLAYLFLVPSGPSLFPFYEKNGFTHPLPTTTTTFTKTELKSFEEGAFPCQKGSVFDYNLCRERAFSSLPAHIAYPPAHLLFGDYTYRQYGRRNLTLLCESNMAYAICEPKKNQVIIKELALDGVSFGAMARQILGHFPDNEQFVFYHPAGLLPGEEKEQPLALACLLGTALANRPNPYVGMVLD